MFQTETRFFVQTQTDLESVQNYDAFAELVTPALSSEMIFQVSAFSENLEQFRTEELAAFNYSQMLSAATEASSAPTPNLIPGESISMAHVEEIMAPGGVGGLGSVWSQTLRDISQSAESVAAPSSVIPSTDTTLTQTTPDDRTSEIEAPSFSYNSQLAV